MNKNDGDNNNSREGSRRRGSSFSSRRNAKTSEPFTLRLKLTLLPYAGRITTGAFFASLVGSIWFLNSDYIRRGSYSAAHKGMTRCYADYQQKWNDFFGALQSSNDVAVESDARLIPMPVSTFHFVDDKYEQVVERRDDSQNTTKRSLSQLREPEQSLFLANYYLQNCARRSDVDKRCADINGIYNASDSYLRQMRSLSTLPPPEGKANEPPSPGWNEAMRVLATNTAICTAKTDKSIQKLDDFVGVAVHTMTTKECDKASVMTMFQALISPERQTNREQQVLENWKQYIIPMMLIFLRVSGGMPSTDDSKKPS